MKKFICSLIAFSLMIPANLIYAEEASLQVVPGDNNKPTVKIEKPIANVPEAPKPQDPSSGFMNPGALSPATPEEKKDTPKEATNVQPKEALELIVKRPDFYTELDLNGKKVSVNLTQLANSVRDAAYQARKKAGVYCFEGCGDPNDLLLLPGVRDLFKPEELYKFEMQNRLFRQGEQSGTTTKTTLSNEKTGTLRIFPMPPIYTGPLYTEKGWRDFATELIRRMDKAGANILTKVFPAPKPIPIPYPMPQPVPASKTSPSESNLSRGIFPPPTIMPPLYRYQVNIGKVIDYLWSGIKGKYPKPLPRPIPFPDPMPYPVILDK